MVLVLRLYRDYTVDLATACNNAVVSQSHLAFQEAALFSDNTNKKESKLTNSSNDNSASGYSKESSAIMTIRLLDHYQ